MNLPNPNIQNHILSTNNPHGVTREHLNLGETNEPTFKNITLKDPTNPANFIDIKNYGTIECVTNYINLVSKPVYNKPMYLSLYNGDNLTGMHLMNGYGDAGSFCRF